MKIINHIKHYFTDLGYHPERARLGGPTGLAVLGIYVAIALGVFMRQLSKYPTVDIQRDNLRVGVAVGSVIIGLVIAPPLMKWIIKRHHGQPSWAQIGWALTYGFFSQLMLGKLLAEITKTIG